MKIPLRIGTVPKRMPTVISSKNPIDGNKTILPIHIQNHGPSSYIALPVLVEIIPPECTETKRYTDAQKKTNEAVGIISMRTKAKGLPSIVNIGKCSMRKRML